MLETGKWNQTRMPTVTIPIHHTDGRHDERHRGRNRRLTKVRKSRKQTNTSPLKERGVAYLAMYGPSTISTKDID